MANGGTAFTTAPTVVPFANMTLERGILHATDEETIRIMKILSRRVMSVKQEHEYFRLWCNRADLLYYADHFTKSGSDLYPDDPALKIGKSWRVSVPRLEDLHDRNVVAGEVREADDGVLVSFAG